LQPRYADAEYNLGMAEILNGNRPEGIRRFRNALALAPNQAAAHHDLGVALLLDGQAGEAIPHLNRTVGLEPANMEARNNLAAAFASTQQWSEAIRGWRETLEIDSNNIAAQMGLAWALATAPDPTLRNGAEALAISQHLSQTSETSNPKLLRILAAAYAEVGRFPEAIETAQRGIGLATSQNQAELAARLQDDLKLFQSAQPVREAGATPITR
jgi:tetratricopeptide (TPR) repeat protein